MAGRVKFTGSISQLKVNGEFTKRLDRDLGRLHRQALRAWIRALFVEIPQWSGETAGSVKFAAGTNGNLGRFLNVAMPISAPHPRPYKNELTGGAQANYVYTENKETGFYGFEFNDDVIQFFLNEFFYSPVVVGRPRPWGITGPAERAYEEYIINNFNRFRPKLDTLVVATENSFGDTHTETVS